MLLTTNLTDVQKLESAKLKAERLCKLHKCSIIDLIILSIDVNAENKKAQNKQ